MRLIYIIYRKFRTQISSLLFRILISDFSFKKKIKISSFSVININGPFYIGSDFFSGEDLYISTNKFCKLSIGKKIMFGPGIYILGGNHKFREVGSYLYDVKKDDKKTKDITIEDDTWVGANSKILSGSIISEGCIIGAGSVVNSYIPPYTIAAGAPCKSIYPRFKFHDLKSHLLKINSKFRIEEIIDIYEKHNIKLK